MAGFKTHITVSTALGIGGGAAAHLLFDLPLDTCILGAGLCGIAGMLPDLDSDSGVPIREFLALAAAVVPMLLIHRFRRLGMSPESMALWGAMIYLFIRFGVGGLLKHFTVHRGMFHSIPAVVIVALAAYLVSSSDEPLQRYFMTAAVAGGYLSHLVLDELWSIEWRRGGLRLKSSSGTALKMWGGGLGPNLAVYAQLLLLVALAFGDPIVMDTLEDEFRDGRRDVRRIARDVVDRIRR